MFCEICNGTLNLLRILGNKVHFNCQNCGMEESLTKDEAEELFNTAQDVLFREKEEKRTKDMFQELAKKLSK